MFKILSVLLIINIALFAKPLGVGESVSSIIIKDQFEKEHKLGNHSRFILFAGDKKMGDMLSEYLLEHSTFLSKYSAIYMADISNMPSFISKLVAIPKMRSYPFDILLLDEQNKNYFTKKDGKIVVYVLDKATIVKIQSVDSIDELYRLILSQVQDLHPVAP